MKNKEKQLHSVRSGILNKKRLFNALAIITLPAMVAINPLQAEDNITIGIQGGSGGSGGGASQAGEASSGSSGTSGAHAAGSGSGGNGSDGVSGGSGANGTPGVDGVAGTAGTDETGTLRNVKGQLGLLQIGADGGEGGLAGVASAGTSGQAAGKGGDGGSGGTTGMGGDGGDGGNGGNGGNGASGGSGGNGAGGGNGTLTINQSKFSSSDLVVGGAGGAASAGGKGQAGGNGGAGSSGGEAGVPGLQAAGGLPGDGGKGGSGGAGGSGGDGANGGNGGNGVLTLNNTTLTVNNTLSIGGTAGQGSNGGSGGSGGNGGDAGHTPDPYTETNVTGETGNSGDGGNGGRGGNGGNGANGGSGGEGALLLENSVINAQSIAIGASGANGGNGGNSGSNGKAGAADSVAAAGKGAAGGQGGKGGNGGSAGAGTLTVANSTLNLTTGMQIGGNGGNGGTGGSLQGSAAAGSGGNGSDGAAGTLLFNSGMIANSGDMQLGGQGGDAGDGGINSGAKGRSGNGGLAGNGGAGTAIFSGGSGQIGALVQLGGASGSHDGVLNNSAWAQSAGAGGTGLLEIRGGTFTAGTLAIGTATAWNALTGVTATAQGQYVQSGGTFQVNTTEINNGSLSVSNGTFASQTLDASQGTFTVSGEGTIIFGSTELNAHNWQESVALLSQTQQASWNGKLILSGADTIDLSSSDLNWRIGGDEATWGLGSSSLTVIHARSYIDSGKVALALGNAQIDDRASLLVLTDGGVSAGESFTAVSGTGAGQAPGWQQTNINTTSRLLALTPSASENGTLLTFSNADYSSALPGLSAGSKRLLTAMTSQIGVDTASDNAAQQFLSQVMDVRYVSDAAIATRIAESAINFASVANVAGTGYQVMSAATHAIARHLSQGEHFFNGTPLEEGFNLWTSLLYDNAQLKGYSAGGFHSKSKTWLGGAFIGAEDTLITRYDAILKTGGALNIGRGKSKASGNLYPLKNDLDFWGGSLYGSWLNNNWNLMADLNYSRVNHEMTMSLPVAGYGKLSGKAKSTIISGGVAAEYLFDTDYFDIIPHIGLRYTSLKNKRFTAKSSGKSLFDNAGTSASLWSIPLGVGLSREFKSDSGYTLKPRVDLSFIATTGDTTKGTKVSMAGVNGNAWSESRLADGSAFSLSAGALLQKGSLTYGLHYDVQKSSHETAQAVSASFNMKF
ncbi:hypothetical protein [Kalamiella sp. sgz302252]|uniref:hypothetical protein n=1 Tax=Pantoea sp. sgz302252 TaxID=3341827 RepID=UPI0036D35981